MRRGFFFIAVWCVFIQSVFGGTYSGGAGTAEQPYRIGTVADLLEIGANPADFNRYFVLIDDIDMTGVTSFIPIGYYETTSLTSDVPFAGYFDGQGFSISNLSITSDKPGIGLFGMVDSDDNDVVLQNIAIIDPVYTATSSFGRVGGLVGFFNGGTIENCHVINPTINSNGDDVGGLIGTTWSDAQISYCSVQSGVVNGYSRTGGFTGRVSPQDVTVFRCYASADVHANASTADNIGGFAGYIGSTPYHYTEVSECFATGNVIGAAYSDYIGGFTGSNQSIVYNCYATGDVSGRRYVGGFSGYHGHNGTSTGVERCYSTGEVTGTSSGVGGFTGYLFTYDAYCNYCYWDTVTSQTTTSDEGLPMTTAQMYNPLNYTGWDFTSVWFMPENDYPKLRYRLSPADFDASNSVTIDDFAVFANAWQTHSQEANYNLACDLDLPADGVVDMNDLAVFVGYWLTN